MIDDLVAQIESRFSELQDELADPQVIGDRERFTAASRAYRDREPAARLAAESRRVVDDLTGERDRIDRMIRDLVRSRDVLDEVIDSAKGRVATTVG
jgi:peptide chain release factor 1